MDLASRARALFWALLGALEPATVLDVNVAKSFFSAAACSAVPGAVAVLRAGAAGVRAAGFAGVGLVDIKLAERGLALPLKGVNRCGESAAGLRAMQDINTASVYVQDALDNTGPNFAAKHAPANSRVFRLKAHTSSIASRRRPLAEGRIKKCWIQKISGNLRLDCQEAAHSALNPA